MARIRHIAIQNFRGIRKLEFSPTDGINCLIGPGDSGKSSILDAIEACLSVRRNVQFTDADFHNLDVTQSISIALTVGELDDALKSIEAYGLFLRGFDKGTGAIVDEPGTGVETVITVNLSVSDDLEPSWTLLSDRATAQGAIRSLGWSDRVRLAPMRIGATANYHLGWRRGSVLSRLSEEKPDASDMLLKAARDARAAFGLKAGEQLGDTLKLVEQTASTLGIPVGNEVKAMLDADSVSFASGTISLHSDVGIPLHNLGTGSSRLLIAGLQREAASDSSVLLLDELEYGLEPHRIIRLLGSLGGKDKEPVLQAFVTTHSPTALRELSGNQLFVVREIDSVHSVQQVGVTDELQSTLRVCPEAFLAFSILVCEGASEVGLLRGFDQVLQDGSRHLGATGVALVDAGGVDAIYRRVRAFQALGYRVGVLRDDDRQPDRADEVAFVNAGGALFKWREGRALEDELFLSLSNSAVLAAIEFAESVHGEDIIAEHVRSASKNTVHLNDLKTALLRDGISEESRRMLARAARAKRNAWYKTVTLMESIARDIIAHDEEADEAFRTIVEDVFTWGASEGR